MSTPEQPQGKTELTRYVEVLRSREEYPQGDTWISITDAARITRTSEAMARRWVTSGRLPVKQEAVGIPKHTRLVRMSDVAAIRPIIDPTAAITDEIHKIDLPSIPRQQQKIMQDHQRLLEETAHLQGTIEQYTRNLHQELDKRVIQLTAEQAGLSRTLEKLQAELRQQTNALQEEQRQRQQNLKDLTTRLTTQDQESQARLRETTARLDAEREAQSHKLQETSATLEQTKGSIAQMQRDLQQSVTALQTAIESAHQEAIKDATTLIEQNARSLSKDIATLEHDQAKDVATLNEQLDGIAGQIEHVNTTINKDRTEALSEKLRITTQDKRISELERLLEEERQTRIALSQQLQAFIQSTNTVQEKSPGREHRR